MEGRLYVWDHLILLLNQSGQRIEKWFQVSYKANSNKSKFDRQQTISVMLSSMQSGSPCVTGCRRCRLGTNTFLAVDRIRPTYIQRRAINPKGLLSLLLLRLSEVSQTAWKSVKKFSIKLQPSLQKTWTFSFIKNCIFPFLLAFRWIFKMWLREIQESDRSAIFFYGFLFVSILNNEFFNLRSDG